MARYFKAEDVTPYLTKYIPSVEAVERSKIDKAVAEVEELKTMIRSKGINAERTAQLVLIDRVVKIFKEI